MSDCRFGVSPVTILILILILLKEFIAIVVDLIQLMIDELKTMDFMSVSALFFYSLTTNNYWIVVDANLFYPFEKAI